MNGILCAKPEHAVGAQCERTDSLCVVFGSEHAFADRCVEAPNDIGDPQGRMSFQFSFVHVARGFSAANIGKIWCKNCPV